MSDVLRILDANVNRAREALRVMEEAARFLLEDQMLCIQLKDMRHAVSRMFGPIPGLEMHRNAEEDVGAEIRTPGERTREGAYDVVRAAGKRLSEALRVIEEYGKSIYTLPTFADTMQSMRFSGYQIEHELLLRLGSGRRTQWRVCVLISEELCAHGDWYDIAGAALDGGADCLQLREKSLSDRALLKRACELVALAHPRAAVIVNDRPDIAMLSGADGVHLGRDDLDCRTLRRFTGAQLIIGVSTSTLAQAKQAFKDGADYCGVGPMFPTTTKRKDILAGPEYLREYVAWSKLPHLAIGGITPGNVAQLVEAGAQGVAVSSAVCAANDPAKIVAALRTAIETDQQVNKSTSQQ